MLPILSIFSSYLPQNSTQAPLTDALYNFLYWVSVCSLVPTIAAMLYFAIKYRASKNKKSIPFIHGNAAFEWTVSVILSIVFLVIFIWGLIGFNSIHSPPSDAYEISVIGQQWLWTFQYANGKTAVNELRVPKGVPVRLIMSSKDVIHDFFIPNFRIKQDVVPGLYTSLWFEATHTGENDVFCAQYCGTAHSNMIAKVVVMEPGDFKMWLEGIDPKKVNPLKVGEALFQKRNCVACHSIDGTPKPGRGPTLKGLFGAQVALVDGQKVSADENYIRESIVNPNEKLVVGYPAIMPSYAGQLSEEQIQDLVTYIKGLKE